MAKGIDIDISHVALLAKLSLTEDERDKFGKQLNTILEYIGKLSELDTFDVPPTSHVIDIKNVLREDEAKPSMPKEKALSNAPDRIEDFYRVPKIID